MKRALVVAGIVGLAAVSIVGLRAAQQRHAEEIAAVNQQNLHRAVELAAGDVDGVLRDNGAALTASKVSRLLVRRMNASSEATAERDARRTGRVIEFHEAQAFEPWQVAVVPDESHALIRIEGYGPDLVHPMLVKEVPLPRAMQE